ncbi:hypothetical protein C0J52_27230 [Blattella germanica]|nr:hypothetical protein C0J52_27230 [Blattella germanica]
MEGIQNETFISLKPFITLICDLHFGKDKTQSFGTNRQSSIDFNMRPPGGTRNIEAIFHLIPCRLEHIRCNSCQGVPYAVFQMLNIVN